MIRRFFQNRKPPVKSKPRRLIPGGTRLLALFTRKAEVKDEGEAKKSDEDMMA